MKNLLKLFTIAIFIGSLTSCADEFSSNEYEDQMTDAMQATDLSGESLPEIDPSEFNEYAKEEYMNKIESNQREYNDVSKTELTEDLLRDNNITTINCGSDFWSTTSGQSSTVEIHANQPDQLYKIVLPTKKRIKVDLYNLSKDLDLFIYSSWRFWGVDFVGSEVAKNIQFGTTSETVDVELEAGTYYIIVESWATPGSFKLRTNCYNPVPVTSCRYHEDLNPSYNYGVSYQSDRWCKWPGANDGKVLNMSPTDGNNVVKFDGSRFGYQDAVRHLGELPLSGGVYTISWYMYIPSGKRAEFVTEKTDHAGQEQGVYFKLDNGHITTKHAGHTASAGTHYPESQWFKVKMIVDMNNRRVYTRIGNSVTIKATTRKTVNSSINRSNKIFGIDFFTKVYSSKFHIDNVCVTEGLEGGHSIPSMYWGVSESIDLTNP